MRFDQEHCSQNIYTRAAEQRTLFKKTSLEYRREMTSSGWVFVEPRMLDLISTSMLIDQEAGTFPRNVDTGCARLHALPFR
jgi:hypothetical protein